jgi:5-methylcytosine-specific restriction endonuclease McrA
LFYSPNNVQGVCKPCHDEKTGSMHGIGNRKESLGGLDNNGRVVDPHS